MKLIITLFVKYSYHYFNSDKKDKKSNKSPAIQIPKMTNYDNNGTPIPSPSTSSSYKGSPTIPSSPFTSSSYTRKVFKRTESNASATDYERPLYERRFTFDRINSTGYGSSSSANTVFGSALYEAANEGLKKEIFTQHVLKVWPELQNQTADIMVDIEYKSLPVPLATTNKEILEFINEPLAILEDLDLLLDNCADILLESAPKHSVRFSLSDDLLVNFKTQPPPPKNERKSNKDVNMNISDSNNNIEQSGQQLPQPPLPSPGSPRKLSKACRI